MTLNDLADRLDSVGDAIAGTGTTLARLDPGARAFGGDAPGALGELGRRLYNGWSAAVAARSREAAAHAGRLADAAYAVRQAAAGYHDVEQASRDRSTSRGA